MLVIRYRWKGKCPKHPHYNPEKHGEGAIKASCLSCWVLFRVYSAHRLAMKAARAFEEMATGGESIPSIRHALEAIKEASAAAAGESQHAETSPLADGDGHRSRLRSAS